MTDTTLHDCRTVGSNFLRNSAYSINAVILGFAPHPAAAAKVTLGFEEVIEVWTTETPMAGDLTFNRDQEGEGMSDEAVEARLGRVRHEHSERIVRAINEQGTWIGPMTKREVIRIIAQVTAAHDLSPWQTNPTAGTPDMARDLDRALKARDEDDSGNRHTLDEVVEELGIDESDDDSANEVDWPQVLKAVTRTLDDGLQYGNWPWNQPVRARNPKSA